MAMKVMDLHQSRQERLLDMGFIGRLVGGGAVHKPGNIVVLVVFLCFLFALVIIFTHDSDLPRKEIIFSLISVITLSLGYYFGKKSE